MDVVMYRKVEKISEINISIFVLDHMYEIITFCMAHFYAIM